MTEIDFITAFGRLLRDGKLRDAFAASPQAAGEAIHLRPADRLAWQQLVPADVEFQADVLLRKRLDLVKFFAPETCRRLGEKLWPIFCNYARANWPADANGKIFDAFCFCRQLNERPTGLVAASEWNRLDFAFSSRRAGLHWAEMPAMKSKSKRGLQFFIRGRGGRWWEFFLHFGL